MQSTSSSSPSTGGRHGPLSRSAPGHVVRDCLVRAGAARAVHDSAGGELLLAVLRSNRPAGTVPRHHGADRRRVILDDPRQELVSYQILKKNRCVAPAHVLPPL